MVVGLEEDDAPLQPTGPRGLLWILAANVAVAVDYSLAMPTCWKYVESLGGSEDIYGLTIAAFPIGRICLLLLIGFWSDNHGFRSPFRLCFILSIVGGTVYGLASASGLLHMALAGRLIAGTGATAPLSAWAARSYAPAKRVRIESMQKTAQLLGVMLGPALNITFVDLDLELGFLRFTPETMAGYAPALINVILLWGFEFCVSDPTKDHSPWSAAVPTSFRVGRLYDQVVDSGAWVCMVLAFGCNLQVAAIDTIATPLVEQHLGWTLTGASLMFGALAGVSFVGAVLGILANKRGIGPMRIIFSSCVLNLFGCIFVAWSLWQAPSLVNMSILMPSAALVCMATLLYSGPCGGVFQLACGNAQGLLGGLYMMAFAGGRPVGAILAGRLLGGQPTALCMTLVALNVVVLLLQAANWSRLKQTERLGASESVVCMSFTHVEPTQSFSGAAH
eukprot:TRINITY_DN74598_c0_g1_i1.p1 TRINITY_DN74598_c0_g1~~TRINITY_DN74598_c0_g1_i1.p1  ORF type:complete len:449 (-),score=54.63 TRINITY_DN74598_c0_g1_i1:40-1386(-)